MADIIKQVKDNEGNNVLPITHVNAVRDSNGDTLPDILDRDYPTTSKTPVEGSTEVSLVTRGEKYDYDKVNNATDVSGASGIGADFKYLLLNGTTGEFEQALEAYVNEKVRSAIGSLINNLDKGTGVKAVAGIDNNNDLGTITPANLASVLSADGYFCQTVGSGVSIPSVRGKYGKIFLVQAQLASDGTKRSSGIIRVYPSDVEAGRCEYYAFYYDSNVIFQPGNWSDLKVVSSDGGNIVVTTIQLIY